MRTIERTGQFKRDFKRESNGLKPLNRLCDGLTAFGYGRIQLIISIKIATND
jgi:hypothetical protein